MKNKILNFMNFVRLKDPRMPDYDMYTPVVRRIKMMKDYNVDNTFLLQYDTFTDERFQQLFLREKDEKMEIGVWLELCRPLVERVGIEWRGRPGWDWDWYVNPGFIMAYTNSQKEKIIDCVMEEFNRIFGFFPETVCSWMIDAYTMEYISKKYKSVKIFGVCREQFGVDAYTVWGGYYNQPYYPSKYNMLCPASTKENQINVPLVKLLGIDPIYGYGEKLYDDMRLPDQICATIEPTWPAGHDREAVEWYFKCYFDNECLSNAYMQTGQENGFPMENVEKGLYMQLELAKEYEKQGKISILKMCDTGRWFSENYASTPATALVAEDDWSGNGYKNAWYSSKNYRASLFLEKDKLYFRDIFKFDEKYKEHHYDKPCLTKNVVFDNLPVVDGRVWSSKDVRCGLFFDTISENYKVEGKNGNLYVSADCKEGNIRVEFLEDKINISVPKGVAMHFERGCDVEAEISIYDDISKSDVIENTDTYGSTDISVQGSCVNFSHRGTNYKMVFEGASLEKTENGYKVIPDFENISIRFE